MTETKKPTEALVKVDSKHDLAVFNGLVEGSSFKRFQLMGSNSDIVKQGKFPMGHFAIVDGQEMDDVGDSVDCVIVDWRPKAMRIGEEMVVIHDAEDEEFKKIIAESDVQDSGCMYGPEFLLWLPEKGFVPYFLNNKSARYEAKAMFSLLGKAATIKSVLVKGQKYSWHAPKVKPCTVPFDNMPTEDEFNAELEIFRNPDKVQKAYADAAATADDGRAR